MRCTLGFCSCSIPIRFPPRKTNSFTLPVFMSLPTVNTPTPFSRSSHVPPAILTKSNRRFFGVIIEVNLPFVYTSFHPHGAHAVIVLVSSLISAFQPPAPLRTVFVPLLRQK